MRTVADLVAKLEDLKSQRTRLVYWIASGTRGDKEINFERLTDCQAAIAAFEQVIASGEPEPPAPDDERVGSD